MHIPWKWMRPKKTDFSIGLFIRPPLPSIIVCRLLYLQKGNGTERQTLCASCVSVIHLALFVYIDESLWEFWLVYIHVLNGPGLQKARVPGTERASKWDMHNIFTRAVCFAVMEWWCPNVFISFNLAKQLNHSQALGCPFKVWSM